ncbi:MAG: desulfoferrodoxin [Clostridia bacterium]|nr:desulfoferrodoxin [Clostridia bacterium]
MLKIYQNENSKQVIISKEELQLNGWKELIAGSVDAAVEKHVPVVTKKCKTVQVDVGSVTHPMTEEHWIEWVALETEKGLQMQYLKANEAPSCTFKLADGDKAVAVYAYCNLHGLWKA